MRSKQQSCHSSDETFRYMNSFFLCGTGQQPPSDTPHITRPMKHIPSNVVPIGVISVMHDNIRSRSTYSTSACDKAMQHESAGIANIMYCGSSDPMVVIVTFLLRPRHFRALALAACDVPPVLLDLSPFSCCFAWKSLDQL